MKNTVTLYCPDLSVTNDNFCLTMTDKFDLQKVRMSFVHVYICLVCKLAMHVLRPVGLHNFENEFAKVRMS